MAKKLLEELKKTQAPKNPKQIKIPLSLGLET